MAEDYNWMGTVEAALNDVDNTNMAMDAAKMEYDDARADFLRVVKQSPLPSIIMTIRSVENILEASGYQFDAGERITGKLR